MPYCHYQQCFSLNEELICYRYDSRLHIYCLQNANRNGCYGNVYQDCSQISEKAKKYLQEYYSKHNKNLFRFNQKVQFSIPDWLKVYG